MSPEGSSITFRRVPDSLNRIEIGVLVSRLETELARGRTFDCLITGDAELRRLNREFLGRDYPTDVLSFPSGEPRGPLGDIAISLGRARAQAREFGHPIETEVCILLLHGVLHLMGMDHEHDGGKMARAEKKWRARLGLPAGLIERVEE
jgi:probable rRNA maturation factor